MNKILPGQKEKSNLSLLMIFSGVVGYILIVCLFFYEDLFLGLNSIKDIPGIERKMAFNYKPFYMLWLAVIFVQPAIWAILLFPATAIILNLKEELKPYKHFYISFILLIAIFAVFIIFTRITVYKYFQLPLSILENHLFKLQVFTFIGQFVGLYILFGAVLISKICFINIYEKKFDILIYRKLKSSLDIIINFTGVIFSLGIIGSIILNKSLDDKAAYPGEFVISFGIMNSLIILLVYLPAHFQLLNYGQQIIDYKYGFDKTLDESEIDLLNKQNDLSKNLNLSIGLTQTFKTAFVILSPVISGLIPKLFDFYS